MSLPVRIVQAVGLRKRYGAAEVVRGIDFAVSKGECFGILGPNGAWAILAIPMVMLAGAVFGALALVMTAVARGYDFFIYYFTLVITPMFLFSGVFFPLDGMPVFIRVVAGLLPLNHVVEVVRPLMTGGTVADLWLHIGVLLAYGSVGFGVATVLFRRRLLS